MHTNTGICKIKKKLVPYGTDGQLFRSDVSANFKVTWHKN